MSECKYCKGKKLPCQCLLARAGVVEGMLCIGERIAFGSDAAIIRELMEAVELQEAKIKELEALCGGLYKETLKMLHENVCYQLSDDLAHYHPDRPSAEIYKKVESVLNGDNTRHTEQSDKGSKP